MTVFVVWISATFVLLGSYILILWLRQRRNSRFRAKLTILFLLFVMIPTVPLTFLIAQFMTRSADLLLMPGIGRALNTSLETLRFQLEEKGKDALQDPSIPYGELSRIGITCWARFEKYDGSVHRTRFWSADPVFQDSSCFPGPEQFNEENEYTSSLYTHPQGIMLSLFRRLDPATILVAVYPVPQTVLTAKDEIDKAAGVYGSLSYIKESIIEKNLIWALAVLLIAGLSVMSIAGARQVSRGISEPIHDLVLGMKRASAGDLSQPVKTKAKDEFRFLVDSFNSMIEEMEAGRKRLLEVERIAAWQDVARQISHEMKNSLTPIALSMRRLRTHIGGADGPKGISSSLRALEYDIRAMETMAAEFSAFSRLPLPNKKPVDINRVIRSAVQLCGAESENIKLELSLDAALPSVGADGDQIKRVLINLIKNSIEASSSGQTIRIESHTEQQAGRDGQVLIVIEDEGQGMDETTLANLFKPYFTTKKKGMGLGMAVVRKIVDDHNGDIRVTSLEKKGTRVEIRL